MIKLFKFISRYNFTTKQKSKSNKFTPYTINTTRPLNLEDKIL